MREKYKELLARAKEKQVINQISMLLGWDNQVMMPPKAVQQRGEQMAFISKLEHERSTDPRIGELIKEIEEDPEYENLSEIEKRNVYLIKREYERATKVPADFIAEFTRQSVITQEVWKNAKQNNDFESYKPYLKKILEMGKQFAKYINPDLPPYDVLLDYFEPGMNTEKYDKIFIPLKEALVPLIKKCKASPHQPNKNILFRKCPIEIQKKLSLDVIPIINYDLERGRLDEAAHPFTTGNYDDVRITTRYLEDYFPASFFATMHEGGHACYDQNLKVEFRYQPVGNYCSMGIHEANSRFYENIIGRSVEFWKFYYNRFKEITGDIFADVSLEDLVHAINKVESSAIRVEADELTYNLHIILRYELERDLMEGKIEVDNLPEIWNNKMQELLDYDVKNDTEGVLQDIHWSGGMVGYFPTYSMGNIYGAQFLAKLEKDIPNWREEVEKGNVQVMTDWMKENVQEKGNLYDPADLVKEVTGEEPTSKYLINYLTKKYSKLYKF
ncbi:MAG: carboxypeptidase M32 [Candidatus Heimdallarchaeaceae archaeon]